MSPALKLAGPLLRSTLTLYVCLWMLLAGQLALFGDLEGVGQVVSLGGGALLVLATALGINLRRCRQRGLGLVLPGFVKASFGAVGLVLGVLTLGLALIDGWAIHTLQALVTSCVLGLGGGLAFRTRLLAWVALAVLLLSVFSGLELYRLWGSTWSPALAVLMLGAGAWAFLRAGRRRLRQRQPSTRKSNWSGWPRAQQPHRFGQMLSPWTGLTQLAMGALLGIWLGILGHGGRLDAPLNELHQSQLAGYAWLFSLLGVMMIVLDLQFQGRQSLRKLATLPGWRRERLFVHAERSLWRACGALLAGLCLVLLVVAAWSVQPDWTGLMLLLFLWLLWALLAVPFGLWVVNLDRGLERTLLVVLVLLPGLFMLVAVESGDGWRSVDPLGLGVLVVAVAILAGWIRSQARKAWLSISFGREHY